MKASQLEFEYMFPKVGHRQAMSKHHKIGSLTTFSRTIGGAGLEDKLPHALRVDFCADALRLAADALRSVVELVSVALAQQERVGRAVL